MTRKPKLIPNWKKAWRMFSVQAQVLAMALLGTWQVMPEDLKTQLPPGTVFYLSMALLVAGVVGRLIVQPSTEPPQEPQP